MKHLGSVSEFNEQRDRELKAAFHHVLKTERADSVAQYFYKAAKREASRFWVSERRAYIVMKQMTAAPLPASMYAKKREMFAEIFRRVESLMAEHPEMTLYEATFEVVNSPAPEFYLTPGSARVILYKLLGKSKNQSKSKK